MKHNKNYNSISILITLKRRMITFITSLLICIIFGSFFINNQIENIEKISQNNKIHQIDKEDKFAIIKIKKYNDFYISPKIIYLELDKFKGENKCINEYFLYTSEIYFDIYAIHLQNDQSCIQEIINNINKSDIVYDMKQSFKNENGHKLDVIKDLYDNDVVSLIDITNSINKKGKPINKHFIYLNKDRSISQKEYKVTSTIISQHKSLNSNKIWIFMVITSIIISIFMVFMVEYLNNIKGIFKYKNSFKS